MFKQAAEAANGMETTQRDSYLKQLATQWRVTADDVKTLNDFDDHKSSIQERLATDFDGLFDEMFESRAKAWEQQQAARQQATMGATQFLDKNQDLLTKHADAAVWAMQNENRRDVALRLVQLEEELTKLRTNGVQNTEAIQTAKARDAITKTRATVRRDPATNAGSLTNVLDQADQQKLAATHQGRQKLWDSLNKVREQGGYGFGRHGHSSGLEQYGHGNSLSTRERATRFQVVSVRLQRPQATVGVSERCHLRH